MRAKESYMEKFLSSSNTRFIIPIYQRNYDWSEKQCKELLDDILEVGNSNKTHFIGNIVLHSHENNFTASGVTEQWIIDGQQRITTITIIYLVLHRLAKALKDENLMNQIYETYLINKYDSDKGKLKLRGAENNDKALAALLNNEDYPEDSNLIKNFNYFKEKIIEENYRVVLEGISKLIFVEIVLEREKDEPQRIFESLNSKGLILSQADLIRNYILMGLNQKNQENIYTNYWEIIEKLVKDASKKDNVSEYLRHYLTLVNKDTPKKEKVYAEFQTKYPSTSLEELENNLKEIKRFAKYYNKLIHPEKETDEEIRQQLKYIRQLEITVTFPFLMQVYADYDTSKIDKPTLLEVLELIESFFLRRAITDVPREGLNQFFMNFYDKVDQENYLSSIQKPLVQKDYPKFPTDKEVTEALKEKDVYNMKKSKNHLLERLENFENTEKVFIENNPAITIEHIFPQKPAQQWQSDVSSDEYNFIKENYLHTIGNLTLSGNNGKLGNKPFKEKRDLAEKGYKDSRLWLNRYLADLEKWDKQEIEKRCELLTQRFLQIWKCPEIEEEKIDEAQAKINTFVQYIEIFKGSALLRLYEKIKKDYHSSIIDEFVFLKVLELLQSFIARKYIMNSSLNFRETKTDEIYNEIERNNYDYLSSIQDAMLQQKGSLSFPTDNEISDKLKIRPWSRNTKQRQFLFEQLKNNEEGIEPEDMGREELTKRFLEIWPSP